MTRRYLYLFFALIFALGLPLLQPLQRAYADNGFPTFPNVENVTVDAGKGRLLVYWFNEKNQAFFSLIDTNSGGNIFTTPFGTGSLPAPDFATSNGFGVIPDTDRAFFTSGNSLYLLELGNGKQTKLKGDVPAGFNGNGWFYNSTTGRLYIPGTLNGERKLSVVVDVAQPVSDIAIVGTIDYYVRGVNPALNRIFATQYVPGNYQPGQGGYHLYALDGNTNTPLGASILDRPAVGDSLVSNLYLNSTSGNLYGVSTTCSLHCDAPTIFTIDSNTNKVIAQKNSPIDFVSGYNEAENKLYGRPRDGSQNQIAVSGDSLNAVAILTGVSESQLIGVDSLRNLIFFAGLQSQPHAPTIQVYDGHNDTYQRTITISPISSQPLPSQPVAAFANSASRTYFAQTSHSLSFGFKNYWEQHGGVATFGYPITEEFSEFNPADSQSYTVQYFERARFEYHPEFKGTPYETELGVLGRTFAFVKSPVLNNINDDQHTYFPQTGQSLAFGFKYYWEHNGGLAVFGYPITNEFSEVNPIDGKTYTVQYFERGRFEYHPEFKGTPYETELGLLGDQYLKFRGWQ